MCTKVRDSVFVAEADGEEEEDEEEASG